MHIALEFEPGLDIATKGISGKRFQYGPCIRIDAHFLARYAPHSSTGSLAGFLHPVHLRTALCATCTKPITNGIALAITPTILNHLEICESGTSALAVACLRSKISATSELACVSLCFIT